MFTNRNIDVLEKYENPIDCAEAYSRVVEEDIRLIEAHHEAREGFKIKSKSLRSIGWFASEGSVLPGMAAVSLLSKGGRMHMLSHTDAGAQFGARFTSPGHTFPWRDRHGENVDLDTFAPFRNYDSVVARTGGGPAHNSLWETHDKSRSIYGDLLFGEPKKRYEGLIAWFVVENLSEEPQDLRTSVRNLIQYGEPGAFWSLACMEAKQHRTPAGILLDLAPAGCAELDKICNEMVKDGLIERGFMITSIAGTGELRPEWDDRPYANIIHVAGLRKR